jgi:hypothetical protein
MENKIILREPVNGVENVYLEREVYAGEGIVKFSFYYKNIMLKHLTLDSEIGRKLAAYHLIEKDLNFAYASIECLIKLIDTTTPQNLIGLDNQENYEFIISKSLFQSAVITYGKCFANSSGGKETTNKKPRGVKLETTLVKDFPKEQLKAHEVLLKIRNEYIAHGGSTNLEDSFACVLASPENELFPNILCIEAHVSTISTNFYKNVLKLIVSLKEKLQVMQDEKRVIIWKKYISKLSIDEIRDKSDNFSAIKLSVL